MHWNQFLSNVKAADCSARSYQQATVFVSENNCSVPRRTMLFCYFPTLSPVTLGKSQTFLDPPQSRANVLKVTGLQSVPSLAISLGKLPVTMWHAPRTWLSLLAALPVAPVGLAWKGRRTRQS